MRKKLRMYVDTSVFGGVFDIEFMESSQTLFRQIRNGQFLLCVSEVVRREIELAPEQVRNFYIRPLAKVFSVRSEPVEERISTVKRALRQAQGERGVEEIMTYARGLIITPLRG